MAQKLDKATLQELIKIIDKTPAVTWVGKGGVKDRIQLLIEESDGSE